MTRTEQQFFALLQGGLWGMKPDASLFAGEVDWSAIYELAKKQTVLGLVGDGLALQVGNPDIPEQEKVPVQWRKKFLVQVVKAERRNDTLNDFIARYNAIFSKAGIVPVIVKGQGVALCYANPSHRQSGDIDYLLSPEEYAKAREILIPVATETEKEDTERLHYNCTVEGITVELHGTVSEHQLEGQKKALAVFLKENRAKPLRYWELNGEKIPLMNHHFNVIYILQHFHHHMLTSGVGLRQLCDWARYIYTFRDDLDENALAADLEKLQLLRAWQIYAALVVEILGMDPARIPLYEASYARYSRRLWRIIDKTGNFGKYDGGRPEAGMRLLPRKIKSFTFMIKQTGRLFWIFPKESFRRMVRGTLYGLGRLNTD